MRLLLIDDHGKLARLTAEGLEHAGFGVDIVSSIAAASRALAKGTYAVVILDPGLPDGDGRAMLRAMRQQEDPTPAT